MLLQFPDINTLTLAISSGTIPEDIAAAPVETVVDAEGTIWADTAASLPTTAVETLKSWNVVVRRGRGKLKNQFEVRQSWLQLVPLKKETQLQNVGDRVQVLFEFEQPSLLPELVNEILRQGNDRQSFRTVEQDGCVRTLLRVIGVPYYSLLRASEGWSGETLRAFVERSPRVWVEAGYQHPIVDRITPAAGQHLLIQGDAAWRTLKEQPFQDVYKAIEFNLPTACEELADTRVETKLQVPVRLSRSSGSEPGEVFVLTKDAVRQLDQFVQSSSDEILERLAFAVTEEKDSDQPTVIIRIRPGRNSPPVLVFEGLACRNYLKIPNLFVPIGRRIHPPLRRDAVRDLLAADETRLVWLAPEDTYEADDRGVATSPSQAQATESFVLRSIADSAFLSLTNWVDYVFDREQETLTAWRQSHQFDFEDFICKAEQKPKKKKVASQEKPHEPTTEDSVTPKKQGTKKTVEKLVGRFRRSAKGPPEDAEVTRLKTELAEVEKIFLQMETPLENAERLPLWNDMADLNAALERYSDSSICRHHQFWDMESPDTDQLQEWFFTEVQAAVRLGCPALLNDQEGVTIRELRRILKARTPTPANVAQLAAWIVFAGQDDDSRTLLRSELSDVQQFLERFESGLAVRACWMAWSALSVVNDDVLMLARARDRILDRMYQHGLTADRDLPSFLRIGGSQSGDRFRQVREKVCDLHETVRSWSVSNLGASSPQTKQYIDLIFAFAHAKLGETSAAADLLQSVESELLQKADPVHRWLFDAYNHRIQCVIGSQPVTEPFPETMLKQLDSIDRLDRYKIDRLRQHSNILEPLEKLDPYREWRRRDSNDLQKQLADLFVENDRDALAKKLQLLLKQKRSATEEAQILTTALELSTRLGEKFANELLSDVEPLDTRLSDPIMRAQLLEKGLQIGAHYDHDSAVKDCFSRMTLLLESQTDADVSVLEALESLLSRSFLSLRKLGMRDEIAFLLEAMSKVVRDSRAGKDGETERLRVLLQLAGGWFYFGQDRGWQDIDIARKLLLGKSLARQGHVGAKKQADLAVSYIAAVGQAPLNDAVDRLQDLFRNLTGIRDGQTVSSHYSLKQLDIVESLVQTIVSDSFTLDKNSQRWMDDEEFLIRRRIHRDVRKLMK